MATPLRRSAASIWFEMWGFVDPDKKNSNKISKISIFPRKLQKAFDLFRQKFSNDLLFVIFSKISVYPDKFSINSKILGTLFYFA